MFAVVQRPTRRTGPAPVLALALLFGLTGAWFIQRGVTIGDALARVVDSQLVLASRDPHLGAVGFVFNPLPALLGLPLVAARHLLPGMVRDGHAGVVVSSCLGAWAVWHAFRFVEERGAGRTWAVVLASGVALNPLFVVYAGNGMSEAPYLCALLGAIRRMARWCEGRREGDLAIAGAWLAVGYLVRYEALVSTVGAAVLVASLAMTGAGSAPARLRRMFADVALLVAPVVAAFVVLLGLSWWLTGNGFTSFSSVYGNSAVVAVEGHVNDPAGAVHLLTIQMLGIQPLLPIVLALCLGVAVARRDAAVAAPVMILGSVLAFECVSMAAGTTFGFLRYLVTVIPLVALSLVTLRAWRTMGLALAVVVLGTGTLSTWHVMGNPRAAVQEVAYRRALAGESKDDLGLQAADKVAGWLDARTVGGERMALGDTVYGFTVLASSRHPERFVMPPDRDYQVLIDYPFEHGIRYVVAVPPEGRGLLDAVNRYYPGLYAGCVKGTSLELVVDGPGNPRQWRIYRLDRPISPATVERSPDCPDASIRLP